MSACKPTGFCYDKYESYDLICNQDHRLKGDEMKNDHQNPFVRWQKRQYSGMQKSIFLVFLGIFFLAILPLTLFYLSRKLDGILGFQMNLPAGLNIILGLVLLIPGIIFGLWAVLAEIQIGQGTPVPIMPTQKLVIRPPFSYCRNPMGLGTGILLIGCGILFNSLSFVLISVLLFILLFLYYKFIEEKELVKRFGAEYIEYRNRTPFLIPRFTIKK